MSHHTTLELDDSLDELADARFEARAVVEAQLRRVVPHLDVGDLDPYLPLRDEAELDAEARARLLRAIEDVAGVGLRSDLLDGDASIDDVARALAISTLVNRWQVTISFADQARFGTNATAVLKAGLDEIAATGEAHKNPADPNVVDVGHEVAAARALLALAHQLLDVATTRITEWDDNATPLTS
jgi:hypothetical protein